MTLRSMFTLSSIPFPGWNIEYNDDNSLDSAGKDMSWLWSILYNSYTPIYSVDLFSYTPTNMYYCIIGDDSYS